MVDGAGLKSAADIGVKVRVFPRSLSASGGMQTRQPQKLLPLACAFKSRLADQMPLWGNLVDPFVSKMNASASAFESRERHYMRAWGNGRPVGSRSRCLWRTRSNRVARTNFKMFVAHERPLTIGLIGRHHAEMPEPGRRGQTVNLLCWSPSHVQTVFSAPCR